MSSLAEQLCTAATFLFVPAARPDRFDKAVASGAAGLAAPVDGVTVAVHDTDRLVDDCRHGLARGFTAKLCIHPEQVPVAAAALAPGAEAVRWARSVVDAAAGSAVAVLDGALVDKPVVDRARSLLARAGQR